MLKYHLLFFKKTSINLMSAKKEQIISDLFDTNTFISSRQVIKIKGFKDILGEGLYYDIIDQKKESFITKKEYIHYLERISEEVCRIQRNHISKKQLNFLKKLKIKKGKTIFNNIKNSLNLDKKEKDFTKKEAIQMITKLLETGI